MIGQIEIYWYAVFIIIAFTIGIVLCKKDNTKYGINFDNILQLLLLLMPMSLIGARIYYIIFNLRYYLFFPEEMLNFRDGGLAIYGGIIGGAIAVFLYTKIKKINFLDMLDYIAPYLALGQSIGRWGNFFNQEAYGTQTNSICRMGIIKNGNYIEVHPTFLYESICTFIIFIILYIIKDKRKYKGQLIYIYLTLYSAIRAIIESLRTDSLMLGNIKISQLLSIILFIVFGSLLIYKMNNKRNEIK